MGRRAIPSATLAAAVRKHFGFTQTELGRLLGISFGFVSQLEAGRRSLPVSVFDRLLPLGQCLSSWTPAAVAPTAEWLALPAPDRAPLEARLDYCQHHAARLRRQLRAYEQQARYAARRQAALPALLAMAPDDATRAWLTTCAAPPTPTDAAQAHLLRIRADALTAEAVAIGALLALPNEH